MTDKIINLKDVLNKKSEKLQEKGVNSREEAQELVDAGRKALSFGDQYDRLTLRLMDACMSIYDEDVHDFIYEVVDGVATNFNVERAKECRERVAMAFESYLETLDEEIRQDGGSLLGIDWSGGRIRTLPPPRFPYTKNEVLYH